MDCVAEDSAQNANVFDMVVLEVKSLLFVHYSYLASLLLDLPSNWVCIDIYVLRFRAEEDTGVATCRVL